MMRRLHWTLLPALVLVAGGCDVILGLKKATLFEADAGTGTTTTGTTTTGTTTSGTGGAGGGTSSSSGTGGSGTECATGNKQCAGNLPQICDGTGHWQDGVVCAAETPLCVGGVCSVPPSCVGMLPTCGPAGNETCCTSPILPKGPYSRSSDPAYPATVSDFRLDRFEITVGRFRKFVASYPGNKPSLGAGEHPLIAGSGWQEGWNANLAADQAALKIAVKCDAPYQTWADAEGGSETKPMSCINWYEAFSFCAWDGGRLPTEAEWNYAAAGGVEQRTYPWGEVAPDMTRAAYDCTADGSAAGICKFTDILKVGATSQKGDGKWGQADLAGNVGEWNLDWDIEPYSSSSCDNCAAVSQGGALGRVFRGGGWFDDASVLLSSYRNGSTPTSRSSTVGARCARSP